MRTVLVISLGAAVGANLRYAVTMWAQARWGNAFPYGTLLVNLIGSLLIGLVLGLTSSRTAIGPAVRLLLVTGLLGGFTTFSSFSYETYQLLLAGSWRAAALNVAGSVVAGLLAVLLGIWLARLVP